MDGDVAYVIVNRVYSEVTEDNENEAEVDSKVGEETDKLFELELHPSDVLPEPELESKYKEQEVTEQDHKKAAEKVCPICNKTLPPNANLSFHRMLHPWTEKPYSCDDCTFITMTREELFEHCKEAHAEQQKFLCDVCFIKFPNVHSLRRHKSLHSSTRSPLFCAYCDKKFLDYSSRRQHEIGHRSGRFQCETCLVKFITYKACTHHCETACGKVKTLTCCEMEFQTRLEYVEHCLERHRPNDKDEYKCEFCQKTFAVSHHLNGHRAHCRPTFHKEPLNLEEMEADKKINGGRRVSVAATRIPIIKEGETKKLYKCSKCARQFTTKAWLLQHKCKHLDGRATTCLLCNIKYSSYASLYYHKQSVHLQIRRFKCTYCNKAFVNSQALRDHVTSHTGEQPYACNFCPKKFRHRSSKIEHLRTHTGERPYQCRYCEQSFKRRHARVSHERRHTGEKPYKCRVCDRCFTQNSTWRSHERKHKPPFICNVCSIEFQVLDTLLSHKENHAATEVEENEQAVQEVCYVMEENQAIETETVENGAVYVQYEVT